MAVAALGSPIDDEKALAVLRLVNGPIAVTDYEIGDRDYHRGQIDGSDLSAVQIGLTPDATVRFVQLNFRGPTGDPASAFPRINSLIDGAAPFTRDTVIDLLGDPAKTTTVARAHDLRHLSDRTPTRALLLGRGRHLPADHRRRTQSLTTAPWPRRTVAPRPPSRPHLLPYEPRHGLDDLEHREEPEETQAHGQEHIRRPGVARRLGHR